MLFVENLVLWLRPVVRSLLSCHIDLLFSPNALAFCFLSLFLFLLVFLRDDGSPLWISVIGFDLHLNPWLGDLFLIISVVETVWVQC